MFYSFTDFLIPSLAILILHLLIVETQGVLNTLIKHLFKIV